MRKSTPINQILNNNNTTLVDDILHLVATFDTDTNMIQLYRNGDIQLDYTKQCTLYKYIIYRL